MKIYIQNKVTGVSKGITLFTCLKASKTFELLYIFSRYFLPKGLFFKQFGFPFCLYFPFNIY